MPDRRGGRHVDSLVADIEDAADAASELVARGKPAWDRDRLLRLAGEALIGRIAEAAGRLPEDVKDEVQDIPWDSIRGMRILVHHIYHRIDYELVWTTLERDIPLLAQSLRRRKRRRPSPPS
jgi:uncharacterized protein with HEPN domain